MSEFWAGIAGVIVGGIVTVIGQWAKFQWETREAQRRNNNRKDLLRQMLDNPGPTGWREMETMAGVIGTDRDETARLLIEIGARSSETEKDVWAYVKNKPLP